MTDEKKTEDSVLNYTQSKREEVIAKLTAQGMPDDPKQLYVVLATLDGMDRAALSKKKIIADSDAGSKAAVAGQAITEILTNLRYNLNTTATPNTTVLDSQIQAPTIVPAPKTVPGELLGADKSITYDNLMGEEA